eukprot:UN11645
MIYLNEYLMAHLMNHSWFEIVYDAVFERFNNTNSIDLKYRIKNSFDLVRAMPFMQIFKVF